MVINGADYVFYAEVFHLFGIAVEGRFGVPELHTVKSIQRFNNWGLAENASLIWHICKTVSKNGRDVVEDANITWVRTEV